MRKMKKTTVAWMLGILLLLLAVIVYFGATISPQSVIEHYQREWNYPFNTPGLVNTCGYFASIEKAEVHFGLSVDLKPCKENPDKRYIAFIERDGLYGFLVCTKLPEKYFCCAELSTTKTHSYLDWKKRCT